MSDLPITITKTERISATVRAADLIRCVGDAFLRKYGVCQTSYIDKNGMLITRAFDNWLSDDILIPCPSADQVAAVETLANLRRLLGEK
jgi:hypothetical protein